MTNLILTNIDNGNQAVSARQLHKYLEIKARFTPWCMRMFEYGFEEEEDYLTIYSKVLTSNPKKPYTTKTDYALSMDCADGIAMIQRTEKGKQARQYFIECEERLLRQNEINSTSAYIHALNALLSDLKQNESTALK